MWPCLLEPKHTFYEGLRYPALNEGLKFNTGLQSLFKQGLSEPECYGDLVYKFKQIVGRTDFSDQFMKISIRYKRIGYNMNVMRQTACLVVNPITVNKFADL